MALQRPTKKPARKKSTGRAKAPAKASNPGRDRRKELSAIADTFENWHRPHEVLIAIEAVPTRFPWLNWATQTGGWPLRRFGLVHGPANHGKTEMALGLGESFLARDHFFGFIDAERTTPPDWVAKIMQGLGHHPAFRAMKPSTFEAAVDAVDDFCTKIGNAKAKGKLPKDTSGIVVVDSITKLVPKNLMAKMEKVAAESDKGSIDGMDGAAGRYIAALNSQWMKRLTAVLDDTGTTLVGIVRERQNTSFGGGAFKRKWQLSGGTDLLFESSLAMRVTRDWVKEGSRIIGQQHFVKIHKTKVSSSVSRDVEAMFHTSNGLMYAAGFDRGRDLLTLAQHIKAIRKTTRGKVTSYVTEDGEVIAQGSENAAVAGLTPEAVARLDELCRANPAGVLP